MHETVMGALVMPSEGRAQEDGVASLFSVHMSVCRNYVEPDFQNVQSQSEGEVLLEKLWPLSMLYPSSQRKQHQSPLRDETGGQEDQEKCL